MELTFEYIQRFASCFTRDKLRARAALWPTPLTWTWFLGARLAEYARHEILEIASVAIAHASLQKIDVGDRHSTVWRAWKALETDHLLETLARFGAMLDAHAAGEAEAAKNAADLAKAIALEQATTDVSERLEPAESEPEPPPELSLEEEAELAASGRIAP